MLASNIFGRNELKNEIRGIENQTVLITNSIFGLNEIKNENRGIENDVRAPNRPLSCATDSVLICGEEIGDTAARTIETDKNNILITIPQSSAYTQINSTFGFSFSSTLTDSNIFFIKIFNPTGSGQLRTLYLDRIFGGIWLNPPGQLLKYESVINLFVVFNDTLISGNIGFPTNLNAGSYSP